MSLILPTIYVLLVTISLMIIFNRSFCYALPVSIISISLLVMLGGYIGDLRIGIYLALLLIPIAVYLFIKKKLELKSLFTVNNIITFFVFMLFILYIGYYHKNAEYRWWDDYSHWGPMVKGMIDNNKLYCDLSINNAHPDYPPLVQCFEYVWCYLARGYSEPSVLRAISVFTFSLFFPIFELFKDKSKAKQILYISICTLVILLLNVISYTYLFSYLEWIYLDFTIATISAITLFMTFNINYENKEDRVLLSIYLTALLITKEIAAAFCIMCVFVIVLVNTIKNKKNIIKDLIMFVIIPCLFFISWKIKTSGINGQFSLSNANWKDAFNVIFFNSGNDAQLFIKETYLSALFDRTIISSPINLPFVSCCVICLIVIVILSINIYKNDINKFILFNLVYILGILGYVFTMLFLYLTSFSVGEATSLASFERYFGIYAHFSIVLITLLAFETSLVQSKKNIVIEIITFILLCSLIGNNYKEAISHSEYNGIKAKGIEWDELVNQLDSVNYKDSKSVLILQRIEDIRLVLNLNYMYLYSYAFSYDMYDNDTDHVFEDKNELIDLYKDKYDYVYIYTSGQELWNVWKLTDNDALYNNRLYKVVGDRLELVPWISAFE